MISSASIGWIEDAPVGNRVRWTLPTTVTPAAPLDPGTDGINTPHLRFALSAAAPGLDAVTVERAALPTNLKWTPDPTLPAYLQPMPSDWWSARPDAALHSDVAFVELVLGAPVQAVRFRYVGPAARCVMYSADGSTVLDELLTPGMQTVGCGAAIDVVRVYARDCTLVNLHTVSLVDAFGLAFTPLARIDVAAGLQADLDHAVTRISSAALPADLPDGWWKRLATWCLGQEAPGDDVDADRPGPFLRAQVLRAARFWAAVLTGSGWVDGPAGMASRVPGDALLGEPLNRPAWVAYRVVADGADPAASSVTICPPVPAARLARPGSLSVDSPIAAYVGQRDIFEVRTTVHWSPADAVTTAVVDEQVRTHSLDETLLDASTECRNPGRDSAGCFLPRKLDVVDADSMLRWRVRAVDSWDRSSDPTDWTPDQPATLVHRPAGPSFDAVVHNGASALFRPSTPLWVPDRATRETASTLVFYRQASQPARADVTVQATLLISNDTYRLPLTAAVPLTSFIGGSLNSGGVWPITAIADDSVDVLATPDGRGSVRLPPLGPAVLSQSPTDLSCYSRVATLPAAAMLSLPADKKGPYLQIDDPVPSDGEVLVYRAAVDIGGVPGVPGAAVATNAPLAPIPESTFTAAAFLSGSGADTGSGGLWKSGATDYFGRTLVVVTLDRQDTSGTSYQVLAAAGSDQPADVLSAGALGFQTPAGGSVVRDMVRVALPMPSTQHLWITLRRRQPDGREDQFAPVRATMTAVP